MDPEYVPPHAMKWMKAFAESREALTAMGDSIGVRGDLPEAPEASPCF
jgi:hypothetical protein